jgi:hypothetical protein
MLNNKASIISGIFLSFLTGVLVCFALNWLTGPASWKDINGRTPKAVLDEFVAACINEDYDKATSLWTKESLQRFDNFREFSSQLIGLGLEYGKASFGKYETIIVIVAEGTFNGKKVWRHFYFEIREGKWLLHRHEM